MPNGAYGSRYITKLSIATGAEAWTMDDFGDSAGNSSFYEMIEVTGDAVFLAGGINKPNIEEMSFKSYGNVADGQAHVERIPLSALQSASKPQQSQIVWTYTDAAYLTAKAARPVNGGKLAVLLYGELKTKHSTAVILDATSGAVTSSARNYDAQGEGTDLQASLDGASFIIAGQGKPNTQSAEAIVRPNG